MTTLRADPLFPPPAAATRAPARADVPCAHCRLPVPPALLKENADAQFCCHACDTAFHAIRACGLDRYYEQLRADPAAGTGPSRASGARYDEFDDPVFTDLYCADLGPALDRTGSRDDAASASRSSPRSCRGVTLLVEGLHCAACVWLLERVPGVLPGLIESRVDYGRSQIRLVWDPARVALSEVARFIDRLGYALHPLRERTARDARTREDRDAIIRIGIAGALFGNAMIIAFALYGGMLGGIEPHFAVFFRAAAAVLAITSVVWPGAVFFRGAIASLRVRTLHMDVPIALALTVGLVHGLINTFRGTGEVYFDTLCTLVFLLLIGRWIQQRQQRRAADSVELLYALTPSRATKIDDAGTASVVPVEALRVADIVEIDAGRSAPVDGEIVAGSSAVDTSLLTGESRPVDVSVGDPIAAGTVNLSSPLRIRVAATGRHTRVGQLMALVEEHARSRAPIVRLADRISVYFVAVVLTLTALTLALWLWLDPSHAAEHAVALLVITCPCALGLATPLAVVTAIGRAARRGILVKGGESLEALSRRGTIVLDKTGTLTTGALRVEHYHGPPELQPLIAAAERRCNHPAARALVTAFTSHDTTEPTATIRHSLGGGIEADVAGVTLTIGSERFLSTIAGVRDIPVHLRDHAAQGTARGLSPIYIARDGEPCALALVGDDLRPEARAALDHLRRAGWRPVLLSGDDERVAAAVGSALGINARDVIGAASPERKLEIVRELASRGETVMVGDGVNDAAALSAATVGVAVQGGAEAAMAAADVFLSRPGLTPLVELIDGARLTTRTIRRNLTASLLYNVLFGALAIAGLVNPLVAAVLMPISGITVVVLSFRTRAFAPRSVTAQAEGDTP